MRSSYILIDEYGRFLDSSTGGKIPTKSILDVGLDQAVEELLSSDGKGYHQDLFFIRGGYFPEKWSKNK
jgi:radical S-adenosyl methionine domain-containing protein 2